MSPIDSGGEKSMFASEKKQIRFHHVGIAARTHTIKNLFTEFVGLKERTWFNQEQGVEVTFLPVGNAYLEMVYPHGNQSIERYIEKHGEGIYHFCFEVDDLDYWAGRCEEKGFKIVSRDQRCFFIHPKTFGGILVEFAKWPEDDSMSVLTLLDKTEDSAKL
jgi:methylmalonyl-CoA/ethylmalonyl-CoA epimerase